VKMKIRKGDTVEVITGRELDKGKRGEVIRVDPKNSRIVTQGRTISPGIIEFEGPIHISNVMLVCPKCDEPTRVAIQREDGESLRVCKQCERLID
jgi:large subunit ribosomal protein L24